MKRTTGLTIATAAALVAGGLLTPAAAGATPILAETTGSTQNSTCTVTGGTLSWGVKESFRSYISGSIANGSWDTSGGASYATPNFSWATPSGEVDAVSGAGQVAFPGTIHFTGHDGALDLTLANPTIVFGGDGTAQLLMDAKSQRPTGEIAIDEPQAYLGKIEGLGQTDPASGQIAVAAASTVLTSDGATAFGDFYASGDALDPIALSLQFGPCEGTPAAVPGDEKPATGGPDPVSDTIAISETQPFPWLPVAIGGAAVLVIAVTGGMLLAGRKKGASDESA